nr:hypothetical protein [uncultured Allomuricauda sp.]
MELRRKTLEQIEQFIACDYLSIANVCFFMQSLRVLMEIDGNQSKYSVTNLYCNWILHKELDRGKNPSEIIEEIAYSFQKFSSKNDLIKKINNAISLKKLVTELKEILWTNVSDKVKVSRMDYEDYWIKFIQILLSQLLFRPIKLKTNSINLNDFQFTIYGLQIVTEKDHYNIELLSKELEEKNKRFIIDIALFREYKNTTPNNI